MCFHSLIAEKEHHTAANGHRHTSQRHYLHRAEIDETRCVPLDIIRKWNGSSKAL